MRSSLLKARQKRLPLTESKLVQGELGSTAQLDVHLLLLSNKKKSAARRGVTVREKGSAERDRALTGGSMLSLVYML